MATASQFSGADPLIYRLPLRSEHLNPKHLNGKNKTLSVIFLIFSPPPLTNHITAKKNSTQLCKRSPLQQPSFLPIPRERNRRDQLWQEDPVAYSTRLHQRQGRLAQVREQVDDLPEGASQLFGAWRVPVLL